MSRRQHYRDFYQGPTPDGRPLGLVHGNCQAEALRVLLGASPSFPWQVVRVPPVHELAEPDLAPLDRLLARCSLLVTQPVQPGYRGMPLGTSQVANRLGGGAQVVRWPVVRYAGLHPWQAIVRLPDGAEPPLVPYHDLRTLTGRSPRRPDLLAAAEQSRAELARRERRDTDVSVSDLLAPLGPAAVHTVNHPGNALMVELARRVQSAVGARADAAEPGRILLGDVRAPLEKGVLAGLGLDQGAALEHWVVAGQPVPAGAVTSAHRQWYASRPDAVQAGLARYGDRLAVLGLL